MKKLLIIVKESGSNFQRLFYRFFVATFSLAVVIVVFLSNAIPVLVKKLI
ncbi:hypothetical protein [Bartonella grahamii]|nr:hypothetical protein [Bartonella grahamii]